ncbi:MAG: NAD(P)H-hydrate dehydratase, partial [Candidatus Poribacteria bacterium]
LGPGLSTADQTEDLVRALVNHAGATGQPMVLDADALNAISPLVDSGVSVPAGAILTPHPGEMARLLGCSVPHVQAQRVDTAREIATAHAVTVVLKGAPTVIAAPDGEVYFNPTGNPGMATGGSGDVLTGLVAGLLAQGLEPVDAAILGVYAHGLAGDIAARDRGRGLLAGDILRAIPQALLTLDEHTEGEAI